MTTFLVNKAVQNKTHQLIIQFDGIPEDIDQEVGTFY